MDFGRIENFESVNFTLPPDHKSVEKVLGGKKVATPHIYVGGVRWVSDSFVGTIYPAKAKPSEYFSYYAKQFNTIELNASHYRTPTAEEARRWYLKSPPHFKFCPKIHQDISHATRLLDMTETHREAGLVFNALHEKLGTAFMQLPPQFDPPRLEELMKFLEYNNVPGLAVELRHPDWFTNEKALNTLCNFLYKNNLGLVLTDTPGRRDVLHMRLTNKTAFIRFNAHNSHPVDRQRIDDWVVRLQQWLAQGLETFYFFVHTPKQVYMPQLVSYFTEQLQTHCRIVLQAPIISKETPGGLLF